MGHDCLLELISAKTYTSPSRLLCAKIQTVRKTKRIENGESMISQDQETIVRWAAEQNTAPRLTLAHSQDRVSDRFADFCDRFRQLVPSALIKKETDETFRKPAIIIGRHDNIAYQAVPSGKELPPFLEALVQAHAQRSLLAPELAEKTGKLSLPLWLTVYIASTCPHCPHVVRNLLRLADASRQVRLILVDAGLLPEQAAADAIRSVPTILMNEQWRWSGQIDLAEIVNMGISQDPARLSAASWRQMLESGDASRLADIMIERQTVFPAFCELLVHERWSVRLGAMVAAEYLVEEDPLLAADLAASLIALFENASVQAQGDAAYLLGLIRSPSAMEHLKAVASGPYDTMVKDAAEEALDEE